MHREYTSSRYIAKRRPTREVRVGEILIGGQNPIVVQSMTTTPTQDVKATVAQSIALAEAGCQVVRITAQNLKAAEALRDIRKEFSQAGFKHIPLVADIHFLPKAAMEAAKHVEKVRINPGNYADQKKFKIREYSDQEYAEELERLHEAFSPIVLRCRELGKAMRIGTNHGSLSDRILNRYGDTPMGMCESALEFIRIAESHGFKDIVLSMKASNPKVMIQAYRLMVARMNEENMAYPLHLGVTEAGDGDDARIKSAIGIGSLLHDGLGDTIRVSLTEDPVAEIPVALDLAKKATALWNNTANDAPNDSLDPFCFQRRKATSISFGSDLKVGTMEVPRVVQPIPDTISNCPLKEWQAKLDALQESLQETPIEALLIPFPDEPASAEVMRRAVGDHFSCVLWELFNATPPQDLISASFPGDGWCMTTDSVEVLKTWLNAAHEIGTTLILKTSPTSLTQMAKFTQVDTLDRTVLTLNTNSVDHSQRHILGAYRELAQAALNIGTTAPIWIRNTLQTKIHPLHEGFGDALLEASVLSGALLCDGIGDLISVETVSSARQATTLAYNILQGARARTSKTEYVACPSCGRTLFDLQSTTQEIRKATGHLKGVTIAVMGCIVNGPGEMADADFGYVGGAPGKINLYVGKTCVQYHIPSEQAVDALIELIRKHGKWSEPPVDA